MRATWVAGGVLGLIALALLLLPLPPLEKLWSSVFGVTITTQDLKRRYQESRLSILVVAGHDPEQPGSVFRGITEETLTRQIAGFLVEYLSRDPRLTVVSARDPATGAYHPELGRFFDTQAGEIRTFRDQLRSRMQTFIRGGAVQPQTHIHHGTASEGIGIKLYGINKWANERAVDVVVHLHFNDYPRRNRARPGRYTGFAIYVPSLPYPNAQASHELARAIATRLETRLAISNLPQEAEGVIPDQHLIAVGSNASRIGASLLVEYGYLYEIVPLAADVREHWLRELAFQTAKGFIDHLQPGIPQQKGIESVLLPHQWSDPLQRGIPANLEVLKLQTALHRQGLYPSGGKTLRDCPFSGTFGPCTEEAVREFQETHREEILEPVGLSRGTGVVGPSTRQVLNRLFN